MSRLTILLSYCASAGVLISLAHAAVPKATVSPPPPLMMQAEALVHERAGAVHGCGVRLTGGQPEPARSSAWLDLSINVYRSGVGLVQTIVYDVPRPQFDVRTPPVRSALQSAWLRSEDMQGSTRRGENRERSDRLVYQVVIDELVPLFEAARTGQTIVFGVKSWNETTERVYSGKPRMSDESSYRLGLCLDMITSS
jgi:hypothetical protein